MQMVPSLYLFIFLFSSADVNTNQLLEVFLGYSAMHPVKSRLVDFQELDGPDQRRLHRFNKLMNMSADNIVTALAIIKKVNHPIYINAHTHTRTSTLQ